VGQRGVEAKVDVAAYCARIEYFAGESCGEIAQYALERPVLRWVREGIDWNSPVYRASVIETAMVRGDDGTYIGTLSPMVCQVGGVYRLQTIEPNPALDAVRLRVENDFDCSGDREPPEALALLATPQVVSGGEAMVKLEAVDSGVGVLAAGALVARADGWQRNVDLSCAFCTMGRALCSATFFCEEDGDYSVRVATLLDAAGNSFAAADGGPLATVRCGAAATEPSPLAECEQAMMNEEPPFRDGVVGPRGCASAGAGAWAAAGLVLAWVQRRRTSVQSRPVREG
jgi:uncharacterized protein (TIGR03382 family)